VAKARNLGMSSARGEYVCYLDSDDLYYPHKLAAQLLHMQRHADTVMVYTEFSAFDSAGYWDEFHLQSYHKSAYRNPSVSYERMFSESTSLKENAAVFAAAHDSPHWLSRREYRGDLFEAYLHNTVVFTNSMMFRRSLLDKVGYQDPYFGHFHDLEFALRISAAGKVAFLDNPTYKLRYHAGQVSAIHGPEGAANAARLQRGLLRVARTHALGDAVYYTSNKSKADGLLIRLYRAAAIPLLSYGGASAHKKVYFPRRARVYLWRSLRLGGAVRILMVMSYMPETIRRIYFRLTAIWRRLAG
jgi:glycosyltransferase involved in cell wall biosynthesis